MNLQNIIIPLEEGVKMVSYYSLLTSPVITRLSVAIYPFALINRLNSYSVGKKFK